MAWGGHVGSGNINNGYGALPSAYNPLQFCLVFLSTIHLPCTQTQQPVTAVDGVIDFPRKPPSPLEHITSASDAAR